MITVPRCLRAAGAVMMLASVSVAGDTPGIHTHPDRGSPLDRGRLLGLGREGGPRLKQRQTD
jgi:hypothetical protein